MVCKPRNRSNVTRSFSSQRVGSGDETISTEEVGHDFRGMQLLLTRTICQVQFLLTQRVDLGCGGAR